MLLLLLGSVTDAPPVPTVEGPIGAVAAQVVVLGAKAAQARTLGARSAQVVTLGAKVAQARKG